METNSANPFPTAPQPSGSTGPLIAAVIVVVLLAAGGFYFLSLQQQEQPAQDTAQQQRDASAEELEAELNATQTSGAEADVDNLNNSL